MYVVTSNLLDIVLEIIMNKLIKAKGILQLAGVDFIIYFEKEKRNFSKLFKSTLL